MEGGQEPNDGTPQEENNLRRIFGAVALFLLLWLIAMIVSCLIYGFLYVILFYFWIFLSGIFIGCLIFCCSVKFIHPQVRRVGRGEARIMPRGRRAPQGGQTVRVQRMPETAQRRNVDAANPSRTYRLDTASGPSGLQNPVVLYQSGQSCRILQLGQQRTQAESTLSQEGSSRLSRASGESTASRMSGVASGLSDNSSKRTSGRDRIRTRSMTKQRLSEASKQPSGEEMDPSVPGPSHLRSPERIIKSSKYKTESESQRSGRQSDLKSPIPGRSTLASGGVRKREKAATRRGSFKKKQDSDDSEFSD